VIASGQLLTSFSVTITFYSYLWRYRVQTLVERPAIQIVFIKFYHFVKPIFLQCVTKGRDLFPPHPFRILRFQTIWLWTLHRIQGNSCAWLNLNKPRIIQL
jgi:hypothetical protein